MIRNKIHVKAPGNWMNDPNGFLYYKGEYHLFYQYFPYGPRWGRMHWGHAVSKDLVDWEHRKVALFPSKHDDRDGCFSGSAVEHEGNLYLFYTGVRYLAENPEDINLHLNEQFASAQMMVTSEDGVYFDNIGAKKTIIPPVEDRNIGDLTHTRDPKVWRGKDAWYMVLGSCSGDRKGKLLFYRSGDLEHWTYVNSASKDGFSWMWECPDYFETKEGGILSFSPMGFLKDGYQPEDQNLLAMADFEENTCTMTISEDYQFLDYGLDLYAAQSTLDEKGRRILVAWARMPEPADGGWIGMFCLPRVVEIRRGHIYLRPHPDVKRAYSEVIEKPSEASEAGYRLELDLEDGEEADIGGYRIFRHNTRIGTDRSRVAGKGGGAGMQRMQFETPELKDGYHVEIYVDENLIEVFINDGEAVITNVVYGLSDAIKLAQGRKAALCTV